MSLLDPVLAIEKKLAAIKIWQAEWQRAQRELSPEALVQRGVQSTPELEQKRNEITTLNERILRTEKVLTERLELIRKIDNVAVQTNSSLPDGILAIDRLLNSHHHLNSPDIRKRAEQAKIVVWEKEIAKIAGRFREDPHGWESELNRLPDYYGTPPQEVTLFIAKQKLDAQQRVVEWEVNLRQRQEEKARPRTPQERFRWDYNGYKQNGDRDETLVAGLAAYAMGDKDPKLQEHLLQNKYVLARLLPPELLQTDDKPDPIPSRIWLLWFVAIAGLFFLVVGVLGGWFFRNYQCGSENPAADCVSQAVIITRTPAPIAGIIEPTSTAMTVAPTVPTATLAEPTPVTPTKVLVITETALPTLTPTEIPEPTATSTPTESPTVIPPPIQVLVDELRPTQADITDTISIEGIEAVAPLLEPLNVAYLSQYPSISTDVPLNTDATLVIADTATNPEQNLIESFMAMSRLCASNSDLDALLLTEIPDVRILQLCISTGTPMEAISFATFTPAGEPDSRIVYLVTSESAFHTKPELLGYLLNWYTLPDGDLPSGFAKPSEEDQLVALEKFKERKNQLPTEIAAVACSNPALEVVAVSDPLFPSDGKQFPTYFIPGGPYTPQQPFTLSWKLKNIGDCPWVAGSYVKITGNVNGTQLPIDTEMEFPVSPTNLDNETLFLLYLTAPELGYYDARFTLYTLVNGAETEVGTFDTSTIGVE